MTTCSGIGRHSCWTPCFPYAVSAATYVGPMFPRQDIPVGPGSPPPDIIPATYGPVEVLSTSGARIAECPAVGSRVAIPGLDAGNLIITAVCQEMAPHGYTSLVADTQYATWGLRFGPTGCWVESCRFKACVDHYQVLRNEDVIMFNPMGFKPSCPYPCHPDAKEPPRAWQDLAGRWTINQPLD
jgi:hypothetical protein